MSQNSTNKILRMIFLNSLILVLAASCSKAPTGVKAQVKTQQTAITPGSTAATQQAASVNANYKIASIALPVSTDTGYSVDVQLQTPGGDYLPFTTRHENGNNLAQGTYSDDQRGLQVSIQASCTSQSCDKYLLLVTVYKNNQSVFQTFAISYSSDCQFYTAASSLSVGNFYSSAAAAESALPQVTPQNNIATCSM